MNGKSMKLKEEINVKVDGQGEFSEVKTEIVGTTMHIQEFNAMLRGMEKGQRRLFEQGIKVLGVIPMYTPPVKGKGKGKVKTAFKKDWHALKATPDEIDWLLRRHKEFKATADEKGKDPHIIIKD